MTETSLVSFFWERATYGRKNAFECSAFTFEPNGPNAFRMWVLVWVHVITIQICSGHILLAIIEADRPRLYAPPLFASVTACPRRVKLAQEKNYITFAKSFPRSGQDRGETGPRGRSARPRADFEPASTRHFFFPLAWMAFKTKTQIPFVDSLPLFDYHMNP